MLDFTKVQFASTIPGRVDEVRGGVPPTTYSNVLSTVVLDSVD